MKCVFAAFQKGSKTGFKKNRTKVAANVRNAMSFKYLRLDWLHS